MFPIFKSAGNFTAIPKRLSLNKGKTEQDLKAKQGLLTSTAVQNITLFRPDLTFPPRGAFLLFHLPHPAVCTYRMHLETPRFLSEICFHRTKSKQAQSQCLEWLPGQGNCSWHSPTPLDTRGWSCLPSAISQLLKTALTWRCRFVQGWTPGE